MATAGEEEVDYESDPEEAKRSLAGRRREASDDEDGEGEAREKQGADRRDGIPSDESDGEGGAADYDEDEEGLDEVDYEEEVYDDEEEEEEVIGREFEEVIEEGERSEERIGAGAEGSVDAAKELDGDVRKTMEEAEEVRAENQVEEEGEEQKKEHEPFAVPTAGAFYMHDDRFRENSRGRHRRTFAGRKLWESKDDRKWGHDKFEEMTLQERHHEEGRRSSKGHYRARGKNRGTDRGYTGGNRSKAFNSNNNPNTNNNTNTNTNTNNNNQNQPPKGMRGRGPRRYQPSTKNNSRAPATQDKQSVNPLERTAHASSGRVFMPMSNVGSDPLPARKHVFASSLNSASPPFYPSGSSSKDIAVSQRRDVQPGSSNRNLRPPIMDEGFPVTQPNALLRGKNVVDSVGMDKLYIDDCISPEGRKNLSNMQMPPSGSSANNTAQSPQSRLQGSGVALPGKMVYQPMPSQSQVNRISPPSQLPGVQRSPVQNRVQPSAQVSTQQLVQRPGSGSRASSPPKSTVSMNSFDSGEVDSPPESSKSKTALVGKGKGGLQGTGRGSFLYGGAQVMGTTANVGVGHGDQNFPATPAFLPVMQFGGQHPGGIGVPAVGMAFPGYVAQPQGLGNSEMTWLPVLAGAAGALGASYCPPYIAVDGAYHARPSGQTTSTSSSSKENNGNKSNNDWKPSQRPELASDEFGQRQNKPRRYSEMNFGQ